MTEPGNQSGDAHDVTTEQCFDALDALPERIRVRLCNCTLDYCPTLILEQYRLMRSDPRMTQADLELSMLTWFDEMDKLDKEQHYEEMEQGYDETL